MPGASFKIPGILSCVKLVLTFKPSRFMGAVAVGFIF